MRALAKRALEIAAVGALLWIVTAPWPERIDWPLMLCFAVALLVVVALGEYPDTARGQSEDRPLAPHSQATPSPVAAGITSRSRPMQGTANPGHAPAPTPGQITHLVNRVMVAASGDARGTITDAAEARIAQLEQTNDELASLLSTALDEVESLRAQLLREQGVSAGLLERNAALRAAGIATKAERITLRAENAQLRDRLGDYAGEVWARCPNCTGEMAVTDGRDVAGAA